MSILFETLQRLEGERRGMSAPPQQETEELLRCAEEKLASKIEAASTRLKNDGHLSGQPLQVFSSAPASVHGPTLAPAPVAQPYAVEPVAQPYAVEPATQTYATEPPAQPYATETAAQPYAAESPAATGWSAEPATRWSAEPDAQSYAAETTPISVPVSVPASAQVSVPISIQAVEPPPVAAQRPLPVDIPQEVPLQAAPAVRPTRMQRTATILRAALPVVEALVTAFDKNGAAPASSALVLQPVEPPAPIPQPVDLAPIEGALGEIKTLHRDLSGQIAEQSGTLNLIADQLDGVRLSTDRNTRRQHELIEELRDVGKKVNFIAVTALGLTAVGVALEVLLALHVFKIIP